MKLGVVLPLFSGDPHKVVAAAREAEDLGFDGVFVFDHFFPPGAASDRPSLEAFATLAAVAAATERVAVGTLVTRASLRPVGLLAKMASWLDAASEGRLILGVGTGDPIDLPEHRAYGIPMPDKVERRAHLDEALVALRTLFAGERFDGGRFVPPLEGPLAPARAGGPPIWVGGQADEVVRIAARRADGWNGWGMEPEAFGAKARLARAEGAAGGRSIEATWAGIVLAGADRAETEELAERRRARGLDDEAWVGTADELAGFLEALEEAGAAWAVTVLAGPPDRRALVADRVLPAIHEAAPRRV
jgi:alkanesulfonate monooxygenase SsuD/methylene tetrahydromethanopterin reductase-like flavin-dependent oxidoreductase (luciferase family)